MNFAFSGEGKLFIGEKVYAGKWEKNKLIESEISTDVGFVFDFDIPRNS